MIEFPIIKSSKSSISGRKLIYGVGINDSDYIVCPNVDGKRFTCPFYRVWTSILTRCFCDKFKSKNPTYANCSICEEWIKFSNFRLWMIEQDWEGKQLDKDILYQGNKVYSPKTCIFVTREVNSLITDCMNSRGKYPKGVNYDKRKGMYKAYCRIKGNLKHIGYFSSADEAFLSYKKFKQAHISEIAMQQEEPLRSALLKYEVTP